MNFYKAWIATRENNVDDSKYFHSFFSKNVCSLEPLINGNKQEVLEIINFLSSIPLIEFITNIFTDSEIVFTVADVLQFSNFKHSINSIPSLLFNNEKSMTFDELGYEILKSSSTMACKKYGENHSKLSFELGLVNLFRDKSYNVYLTAFGYEFMGLNENTKNDLILKMLIRNNFIRYMIYKSNQGIISYDSILINMLSDSTIRRRKSNSKNLITRVLESSTYSYLLNNIIW